MRFLRCWSLYRWYLATKGLKGSFQILLNVNDVLLEVLTFWAERMNNCFRLRCCAGRPGQIIKHSPCSPWCLPCFFSHNNASLSIFSMSKSNVTVLSKYSKRPCEDEIISLSRDPLLLHLYFLYSQKSGRQIYELWQSPL